MATPARLIVNADDFGLTLGINRAILELHLAGVLPSATLMAGGPAFADAATLARRHRTLGVGCHIVLTDGHPLSPPETITSLIGSEGKNFRPHLKDFLLDALRGRIQPGDIRREALAQIRTLQRAGLPVTHLDTHKHTHVLPQVAGPLLEAAEEAGVPAIRNPFEQTWSLKIGQTRLLRLLGVAACRVFQRSFLAQPAVRRGTVRTTSGTLGISATGRLNEAALRRILAGLPAAGIWELVCHPGYNDRDLDAVNTRLRQTRDIERQALLTVLGSTELSPQPPGPPLIHYGSL